jgi:hypothetical protein
MAASFAVQPRADLLEEHVHTLMQVALSAQTAIGQGDENDLCVESFNEVPAAAFAAFFHTVGFFKKKGCVRGNFWRVDQHIPHFGQRL